jgi:subtilisin family serine protease
MLVLLAATCLALAGGAGRHATASSGVEDVVVTLAAPPLAREGASADRLDRQQRAFLAALRRTVPRAEVRWRYRLVANGFALALPRASVATLAALPGVRHVTTAVRYTPSRRALNAGPSRVGAQQIWGPSLETAGQGVKIGIVDTGVDHRHPYFAPAGYAMPPGFPRGDRRYTTAKVIVARTFAARGRGDADSRLPADEDGHGTHVAGIAAGNASTRTDTAERISGVAPRAYIGNYRALAVEDAVSGSNGTAAELVAAIEAAVADGMDVINLSLGQAEVDPERDLVALALDAAAEAGVVPVVVAGNEGSGYGRGSIYSPGTAARAITVGAVELPETGNPVAASFTSVGPTPLSLRLKPDVAAPGVAVLSASPGGGWSTSSGSSMAGPHVAGIAALLVQRHPEWTPAQVKAAIVGTARPLAALPTRVGTGLVDAAAADAPLVGATPTALSLGLLAAGSSTTAESAIGDLGGGAGEWSVRLDVRARAAGATVAVPPALVVPGPLRLTVAAAADARPGDVAGAVVLSRGADARRIPFWGRVSRPALGRAEVTALGRPGTYRGDTRGGRSLVAAYRYPERAPGLPRTLAGPEQVFRVRLGRPVANFGVAVTSRAAGVTVQPRVVEAGDENRLTGWQGLPVALNPYLDTYGRPVLAAGAVRPEPGVYDVVFDSPRRTGAGRFTFRYWVDDRTPPLLRLLARSVPRGAPVRVRATDAGAGVDPASIAVEIDGLDATASWRDGAVVVPTRTLSPGRHRLRVQVSDHQESRNNENVPAILPNTAVLQATIEVSPPAR